MGGDSRSTSHRPWQPREPNRDGREKFALYEDRLWLAIAYLRLPPVEKELLWIISHKQLTEYHRKGEPVPPTSIGIEELCQVTGFSQRAIFAAVKKLDARHIVERSSGGGQKHKNSYLVYDPEDWK